MRELEAEDERVTAWRAEMFLRLGLPPDLACELAQAAVDHHTLDQLLKSGCPPETAVRILR